MEKGLEMTHQEVKHTKLSQKKEERCLQIDTWIMVNDMYQLEALHTVHIALVTFSMT